MKKLKYATNLYLNDVMVDSLNGKLKPANVEAVARLTRPTVKIAVVVVALSFP